MATTKKLLEDLNISDWSQYTIPDLEKLIGRSNESIRRVLVSQNIKTKNVIFLENRDLESVYERFLTINNPEKYVGYELADLIQCSTSQLYRMFKLKNIKLIKTIKPKYASHSKPSINLSQEALCFLTGSLLGDGYQANNFRGEFSGQKNKNSLHAIKHSLHQKEYNLWKMSLLQSYNIKCKYSEGERFHKKLNKTFSYCAVITEQNLAFNTIRHIWYKDKKIVPMDFIIENFNDLSLAIWYMDDGSNLTNGCILFTNGFSKSEVENLCGFLMGKYGIYCRSQEQLENQYAIFIPEYYKEKFFDIIQKYVMPSMKYKVAINSVNCLETPENQDNQQLSPLEIVEKFNDYDMES
jgi:hypothetical protein